MIVTKWWLSLCVGKPYKTALFPNTALKTEGGLQSKSFTRHGAEEILASQHALGLLALYQNLFFHFSPASHTALSEKSLS